MPDNISVSTPDGLVSVAATDVDGVLFQRVLIEPPERVTSAETSTTDVGLDAVEILPANTNRLTATIHNHSDEQLFILCAPGDVTSTNFTQVMQIHSYMELPIRSEYTGPITAMRPAGSLTTDPVMITEYVTVDATVAPDWTLEITLDSSDPASGSDLSLDSTTQATITGTNFYNYLFTTLSLGTDISHRASLDFTIVSPTEATVTLVSGNDFLMTGATVDASTPVYLYYDYGHDATHSGPVQSSIYFTYPYEG